MKKTFSIFSLTTFFLFLLAAPVTSFAALVSCGNDSTPCTWSDLFVLINKVITFLIFDLGIPLVVIVVIVSGIMLVLNPSKETAHTVWKSRLRQALLGLVIALSAYLIVKVIIYGLTDSGSPLRNSFSDSTTSQNK